MASPITSKLWQRGIHDLASPIRHISFFADSIAEKLAGTPHAPACQEDLRIIQTACSQMQSLVRHLGDWNRLADDTPVPESIHIPTLIEKAWQRVSLEGDDLTEGTELLIDGQLELVADPFWVERLFCELIRNACRFQFPDDRAPVRVGLRDLGERFEITVANQGFGISPDLLPQVKQPFVSGHGLPVPSGAGLGLTVCDALCQKMGWQLRIASAADKVTTVTVTDIE